MKMMSDEWRMTADMVKETVSEWERETILFITFVVI